MKTRRRIQRKRSTRKQKGGGEKSKGEPCKQTILWGDECDTEGGLQCSKTEKRCVPDKDVKTLVDLIEGGNASGSNHKAIRAFLVAHPSIINRPLNQQRETALHIAARIREDPGLINLLLETGRADRKIRSKKIEKYSWRIDLVFGTPLTLAIARGNVENVRQLVAVGTPEEKMINYDDPYQGTPLVQAIRQNFRNSIEIIDILIRAGANPLQISVGGSRISDDNGRILSRSSTHYLGGVGVGPATPLMHAIENGYLHILDRWIDSGVIKPLIDGVDVITLTRQYRDEYAKLELIGEETEKIKKYLPFYGTSF
jgi:hypothetical protein